MASFIFTLGFHEDYILRRLALEKAQPGSRIVVITTKPVVKTTTIAFQNLAAYCTRVGLPEPQLVEITPASFPEMLLAISEIIDSLEEPLIADLSGGMRILVITIYTAIITSKKKYKIYIVPETQETSTQIEIESIHIEALTKELPEEKIKILETIARNPGITIAQLARITGKSEKTIVNHLTELKKLNLTIARGKTNNLYPTKLGELIARRGSIKTPRLPGSFGTELSERSR